MIYKAMGHTSNPPKKEKERILNTVRILFITSVYIDNTEEIDNLRYKYIRHKGLFHLLEGEIQTAEINGNTVKDALKLIAEPWLMTWAKERKQVTEIPTTMLQIPLSATEATLALRNAIIRRITLKGSNNKIKYETLYKEIGIDENDKSSTAYYHREAVRKNSKAILKYYEKENITFHGEKIICAETKTKDGIIFKKEHKKPKK